MDRLVRADVDRFLQDSIGPCVSLYMPTHASGEDGQQDAICLKNLLNDAESGLAQGWMRASDARDFLRPLQQMADDPAFWSARGAGLAMLKSPERQEVLQLPTRFTPEVFVGARFRIRPLLPAVNGDCGFFVLALSQNQAGLFAADAHAIHRLSVPGLPQDLESALNVDGTDRGSQVHAAGRVGPGGSGKQAAVFHGQGGKPDSSKEDLQAYCRMVEQAVYQRLRDERAPLVLACVDYIASIYRSLNRYPYLLAEQLSGNTDYHTEHQLLQGAWPLAKRAFDERPADLLRRYRDSLGKNRATDEITTILRAARCGQVDLLIVDRDAVLWGQSSPHAEQVEVHQTEQPGDVDLLELAAVDTLRNRGIVLEVPLAQTPSHLPAAALLRYAGD